MLYVEELIAPGVVNTMPQGTLDAFADHGTTGITLDDEAIAAARDVLQQLRTADVNLATVTDQLEREGEGFCDSYRQLLA